jgi:hypothetical protein
MRHLIKKQIIELSIDKNVNYYHVQQVVSDRFWNDIVPLLEKSFDAISSEDQLMEIDEFELDLGLVSEKEIANEDWIREVKKKIEEKITSITDPVSPEYAVRSRDRRLGVIGQWMYYMGHGFLTWNSGSLDAEWYQDVLEALAVDSNSFQNLKDRILGDSFFVKRIVTQHPDYFLHKLAEIITAEKQDSLPGSVDELLLLYRNLLERGKLSGNVRDKEFRNNLWQQLLIMASKGKPYSSAPTLTATLIRGFVEENLLTSKIPAETAEKLPVTLNLLKRYSVELKNRLRMEEKQIEMVVQDLNITKNKMSEDSFVDEKEQISKYNAGALDEEGIFIVNAGTVLLHPFLKSLFDRVGLINGSAFIDGHTQETSLYLIHYLGTGQIEAKEFELTLAKVLCSYPLQKPVEPAGSLSPEIVSEADMLLEAAISQWEILKNTSVTGLREGFLQRPGKLFSRNGNLYLQVEKSSIDVLLDYLPWNLSMIMLPWMKDILRVEWR